MDSCPDFNHLPNCSVAFSYLRPNQGVTIIPWFYSAMLLALHAPLAFIRIYQWDKGQWFSLGMALFTIFLTCLEYNSSGLQPEAVYIWIPVALTADVGGALQLIILIWKEYKKHNWKSVLYWRNEEPVILEDYVKWIWQIVICRYSNWCGDHREYPPFDVAERRDRSAFHIPLLDIIQRNTLGNNQDGSGGYQRDQESESDDQFSESQGLQEEVTEEPYREAEVQTDQTLTEKKKQSMSFILVVILFLSASFFVILITLQAIGLYAAIKGNSQDNPLVASWCSPAFLIGGQVYLNDPECHNYTIVNTDRGTGCIGLPGDQPEWLKWTVIALSIEIVLELLDMVMLILEYSDRPWGTMSAGIGVYVALVIVGLKRAHMLPIPGHSVAIVDGVEANCVTHLYDAGLRGAVIPWSDGVFAGWNTVYFGPAGN